jgi:TetR/AcrR family acrAB operon transcriptional repressor
MRRTKEESERTRQHILATAMREFETHGLARTTLKRIAREAGVSRGAVYWHFANKRELFQVMRDQVSLPLFDRIEFDGDGGDPLASVERFLHELIARIASDARTRRTLDILSLRCEYVDDLRPELRRHMQRCNELTARFVALYERARRERTLRADVAPQTAARGTIVFIVGMLRLWLIDRGRTFRRHDVDALIAAHVAVLRPGTAVERGRRSMLK